MSCEHLHTEDLRKTGKGFDKRCLDCGAYYFCGG